MGVRAGSGGKAGFERGSAPTASQVAVAYSQYKKAQSAYNAAAKALNDYVASFTPNGKRPKGDYQQVAARFNKASDKYDKAHDKWAKLKEAKRIADYKAKEQAKRAPESPVKGYNTSLYNINHTTINKPKVTEGMKKDWAKFLAKL